jgi:bifunctional ADP-heptose synthase (sugar kinase/adenylyltransferase)
VEGRDVLTTELIERILATIPHRKIGLLGDLFLDRYLDIDPARDETSVETGLTAYQVVRVRSCPGALGTVVNNLSALGVGRIYPIAVIGDDGEGYELRQALARTRGVELGGLIVGLDRRTPTYTKPMYGTKELSRLDIKNRTPMPADAEDAVLRLLEEGWPRLDALLVLDQVSEEDCGVVTKRVRERLADLGERESGKFVLADSRERIGLFRNVCVKPNRSELQQALASRAPPKVAAFYPRLTDLSSGQAELGRLAFNLVYGCGTGITAFATDGAHGIVICTGELPGTTLTGGIEFVPAFPVTGPIDICGAGDSCSAGIASAVVSGATFEQAAAFGNLIASITIRQIGTTGTALPEQVRARWREVLSSEKR